jgi:hypothetical protein
MVAYGRRMLLLLMPAASSVAACANPPPALMAQPAQPQRLDAPAPAGRARVVFVQGAFDGWYDHASIVDETGNLLGESRPDTWLSVDLPPGDHAFFGWATGWPGFIPFAHICTCVVTHCQEIATMRARMSAGRTYYVFLRRVGDGGWTWPLPSAFDFVRVTPRLDDWPPGAGPR